MLEFCFYLMLSVQYGQVETRMLNWLLTKFKILDLFFYRNLTVLPGGNSIKFCSFQKSDKTNLNRDGWIVPLLVFCNIFYIYI